jgi:hypothetical protein
MLYPVEFLLTNNRWVADGSLSLAASRLDHLHNQVMSTVRLSGLTYEWVNPFPIGIAHMV